MICTVRAINTLINTIYFKIHISVCMDNVYKKSIDQFLFQNDSITVAALENLVKENTWKKNETFFFVNYPTPTVGGFPCMTTKDSVDPNKGIFFIQLFLLNSFLILFTLKVKFLL